jgi:SAM-dependent methyltransferase
MRGNDMFGRILYAFHQAGRADYIIERDDGYVDHLNPEGYFKEYDEWPSFEREALREAQGRVLDVGCGAGRASLWLQDQGLRVVAIDVCLLALKVAKFRGIRDCRLMDVRSLEFPERSFDTIMMLGNNFGIAGGVEETRRVLREMYHITRDDGVIIAESRDPLKTGKPEHLAYHDRNRERDLPPGLVKIRIGFRGEFGDLFKLLMVDVEGMREIIEPTGWRIDQVYGDGPLYCAILAKD